MKEKVEGFVRSLACFQIGRNEREMEILKRMSKTRLIKRYLDRATPAHSRKIEKREAQQGTTRADSVALI